MRHVLGTLFIACSFCCCYGMSGLEASFYERTGNEKFADQIKSELGLSYLDDPSPMLMREVCRMYDTYRARVPVKYWGRLVVLQANRVRWASRSRRQHVVAEGGSCDCANLFIIESFVQYGQRLAPLLMYSTLLHELAHLCNGDLVAPLEPSEKNKDAFHASEIAADTFVLKTLMEQRDMLPIIAMYFYFDAQHKVGTVSTLSALPERVQLILEFLKANHIDQASKLGLFGRDKEDFEHEMQRKFPAFVSLKKFFNCVKSYGEVAVKVPKKKWWKKLLFCCC